MAEDKKIARKPGVCIPWEEKVKELPKLTGDKELVKRMEAGT